LFGFHPNPDSRKSLKRHGKTDQTHAHTPWVRSGEEH